MPLPKGLHLEFTETMRGFWLQNPALDGPSAFDQGRDIGQSIDFTLTIATDELKDFLDSPAHECGASGTLTAPGLSRTPLVVTAGRFNLFTDDPQQVGVRLMRYRLNLSAAEGGRFYFEGTKTVRDDPGLDTWADTTTLAIEVYDGDGPTGTLLGRGVMHILPADFAHQLTTMKVSNAPDRLTELAGLAAFGRYFAGTLIDVYGTVAAPQSAFDPSAPPRERRALRTPVPEVIAFKASDGTPLRLTRYRGGAKGSISRPATASYSWRSGFAPRSPWIRRRGCAFPWIGTGSPLADTRQTAAAELDPET